MGYETGREGGRGRLVTANSKAEAGGTLACWRSSVHPTKVDHASLQPELWITFWLSRKALNKEVKPLGQCFR